MTVILLALATTAALAEQVFMKRPGVILREGPASTTKSLATLDKGKNAEVLERQGKWLKVKAGELTGWVGAGYVDAKKPDASLGDLGDPKASEASAGAAAKGLGPLAAKYAAQNNMSSANFDKMLAYRNNVTPQEHAQFEKEGKIGSGKVSK